MDVSNLGLPSTITDLLNAANGYGKYKINVKLNEELSSSKIDAAARHGGSRGRRCGLHRHRPAVRHDG